MTVRGASVAGYAIAVVAIAGVSTGASARTKRRMSRKGLMVVRLKGFVMMDRDYGLPEIVEIKKRRRHEACALILKRNCYDIHYVYYNRARGYCQRILVDNRNSWL